MSAPGADLQGYEDATLAEESVVDEDELETCSESEYEFEAEEDMGYWDFPESEEEEAVDFNDVGIFMDLMVVDGSLADLPRRVLGASNRVKALGCIIALCVVGLALSTLYLDIGSSKAVPVKRPPFREVLYQVAIQVFLVYLSTHVPATPSGPASALFAGPSGRRCWDELRCFLGRLLYLHCVASCLFAYFDVQPKQVCTESGDCHQQRVHLALWKFAAAFVSVLVIYGVRYLIRKFRSQRCVAAPGDENPLPPQEDIAPPNAAHPRSLQCPRG